MTLSALGIFSAAGAGGIAGDYELIQTQIVSGSSTSSVIFSSLGSFSSTYKHLQLRAVVRSNNASVFGQPLLTFNSDTTSSYSAHELYGQNGSVASFARTSQANISLGFIAGGNATAPNYGPLVVDILDPYSTTKNKTVRTLEGFTDSGGHFIALTSGAYLKTDSTTSLTVATPSGIWVAGTRFSLYGIRG